MNDNDAKVCAALNAWNEDHKVPAVAQGWCLFYSGGSMDGPVQVQRLDSPEEWADHNGGVVPPALEGDREAHAVVKAAALRGEAHALAAIKVLDEFNPIEAATIAGAKVEG